MNLNHKIGIYPWRSFLNPKLLQSGDMFFHELQTAIEAAQSEVHFQVYIFELDEAGLPIWQALCQAAKRGVKIHLWLDAYGSANFKSQTNQNAIPVNVFLHFYSPFKFFSQHPVGMRLHHKIMVIDQQTAFIGGINISNHYKGTLNQKPWLDYALQLQGEICKDLLRICHRTGNRLKRIRVEPKDLQATMLGSTQDPKNIRVLENNWVKGKFAIGRQYKACIRKSKQELWIINSYFIPSNAFIRLLKKAAKRKVNVNLILSGKSDVTLVKNASAYFYYDLLKAGVNIYLYQDSVLHAKLAFADNHWMCIGSYNLNHLSDFGSIECNVETQDQSFVMDCQKNVLAYALPKSEKIILENYFPSLSLTKKLINFLSFQLLRFALTLLFIFQRNSKRLSHKE